MYNQTLLLEFNVLLYEAKAWLFVTRNKLRLSCSTAPRQRVGHACYICVLTVPGRLWLRSMCSMFWLSLPETTSVRRCDGTSSFGRSTTCRLPFLLTCCSPSPQLHVLFSSCRTSSKWLLKRLAKYSAFWSTCVHVTCVAGYTQVAIRTVL